MSKKFPFRSRFEFSAVLAVLLSIPFVFYDPRFALLPVTAFLLLCAIGPFTQRLHFFLPIIRFGARNRAEIAITFDDGPDPATTPLLLDLLSRFDAKGTFFVIGEKAAAFPDLIRKIVSEGHDIGNHSDTHDVFVMLKGRKRLDQEIRNCQEILTAFSIRPRVFRPPAGITNPHLAPILNDLKLACVGFSCRPLDFGNRRIDNIGKKVLKTIRPGDILLLHDCNPHHSSSSSEWLAQVEASLVGLQEKQIQIVPLSRLINQPVMDTMGEA